MVPAGDHMQIRESSRVRTPFSTFFMHDRIGTPVNWVLSTAGRAYLAYCPDKERERILAVLSRSTKTDDRLTQTAAVQLGLTDHQLIVRRCLYRQVGRVFALDNSIYVNRRAPELVPPIRSVSAGVSPRWGTCCTRDFAESLRTGLAFNKVR
jgi:hypothetical protein